ncbi:unnamed protein product [Porites evermanni]|uniref:Uncharacterized protein n=1 Tax=Porites evermanni TaxID=104178 RepID=A0ABN8QT66_9CNID|nr:unnamed protein product [Porites evermanni]
MSFSSVTQPVDEDLASQEQSSVVYSLETESHRQQEVDDEGSQAVTEAEGEQTSDHELDRRTCSVPNLEVYSERARGCQPQENEEPPNPVAVFIFALFLLLLNTLL